MQEHLSRQFSQLLSCGIKQKPSALGCVGQAEHSGQTGNSCSKKPSSLSWKAANRPLAKLQGQQELWVQGFMGLLLEWQVGCICLMLFFRSLSKGKGTFSPVPRGWVCSRTGPRDFHQMGEKQTNTINRWKPSDGWGHTGYLFKELLSPNGNFRDPFHLELAEVYLAHIFCLFSLIFHVKEHLLPVLISSIFNCVFPSITLVATETTEMPQTRESSSGAGAVLQGEK